jgi:UDP-N-acetylmuramoylalanine--D-glutamate ligase
MELSSYQTGDLEYAPHISVITSFFPEHLDYHGSLKNYWQAKANVVARAKKDDILFYHDHYARLRALARRVPCRTIPFAATLPFATKDFRLLGKHNVENMKGCYAVARELGIPDAIIERAMRTFKPLPHRLQNIGEYHGITFWDDAISTTPQSAIAALKTIPRVQTVLLGGQDRGFDFAVLGRQLARHKVKNIVLFPDSGKNILKEIKKIALYSPRIFSTSSMKAAVEFAYRYTPKGTACLLSCASPSYSLWKNFEEKGEEFQKWIRKLR